MKNDNIDVHILIYEYANYDDLNKGKTMLNTFIKNITSQSTKDEWKFATGLIKERIYGKNIMMLCWSDDKMTSSSEYVNYSISNYEERKKIITEWNKVFDIFFEKAFDGKILLYEGESIHWKVEIPVKYYVNEYYFNKENSDKKITETTSFSKAIPQIKYNAEDTKDILNKSIHISITYSNRKNLGYTIDNYLNKEGWYQSTDSINHFPDKNNESDAIIIKVRWEGKEEEIICKIKNH